MPTCCAICGHSQRARIDERLLSREDLGTLADELGEPCMVLRRHRDEHLLRPVRSAQRPPMPVGLRRGALWSDAAGD